MKKIEAIIKPFRLDDVQKALTRLGVQGMTVYEVKGFGRQKGHTELTHGSALDVMFMPKLKIEVVVPDILADDVVVTVRRFAKTGIIGDGKIFVSTIENAVRIRTGEVGEMALTE